MGQLLRYTFNKEINIHSFDKMCMHTLFVGEMDEEVIDYWLISSLLLLSMLFVVVYIKKEFLYFKAPPQ